MTSMGMMDALSTVIGLGRASGKCKATSVETRCSRRHQIPRPEPLQLCQLIGATGRVRAAPHAGVELGAKAGASSLRAPHISIAVQCERPACPHSPSCRLTKAPTPTASALCRPCLRQLPLLRSFYTVFPRAPSTSRAPRTPLPCHSWPSRTHGNTMSLYGGSSRNVDMGK